MQGSLLASVVADVALVAVVELQPKHVRSQVPGRRKIHVPARARSSHTSSGKELVATTQALGVLFVLTGVDLKVMFEEVHLKHDQSQNPGLRKSHKFKDTKRSHWSIGSVFTALMHGSKDEELVVEKTSGNDDVNVAETSNVEAFADVALTVLVLLHPLHVLSH